MKELIEKAKKGDKDAAGEIYKTYYTPLYRYALLRLGKKEDAEDIVQSVFIKLLSSLGRFKMSEGSQTMLPYLYTIARNTIIDFRKKNKDLIVDDEVLHNYAGVTELPSDAFEKKEWSVWLFKAMGQLSQAEREVLELRFLSEFSYAEVAAILEKSEDSIRQLQSRGIKHIRDILKREQYKLGQLEHVQKKEIKE